MTNIKDIKADDDFYLEVYENDYKTSKDRIKEALKKRIQEEWYESTEEFASDFLIKSMMKEKWPTKADEVLLKYLRFIWETEWWTASTKEFTINSNIPKLDNKNLLSM